MPAMLALLSVLLCGSASARAESPPLDDLLMPIIKEWQEHKLSDAQYEQKMKAALRKKRVAPLWSNGFALRGKPLSTKRVRVRDDAGVAEVAGDTIWRGRAGLTIPVPIACSRGCCNYEDSTRGAKGLRVVLACFEKGQLTDLDFTSLAPLVESPSTPVEPISTEDAIRRWLGGSDRAALARALALYLEGPNKIATVAGGIRDATTRPVEVKAWAAAAAFAAQPRADRPFSAITHGRSPRPERARPASWESLTSAQPIGVGVTRACLGSCCRFDVPQAPSAPGKPTAFLYEACFDKEQRLKAVTLGWSPNASLELESWTAWILRRVQEDAKASNWAPETRGDACLAAAVAPTELSALLYCAQRIGDDPVTKKPRRDDVRRYLVSQAEQLSWRELASADYYEQYWVSTAADVGGELLREASLHPLASVVKGGAVVWDGNDSEGFRKSTTVSSGLELTRRYRQKPDAEGMGGSRFYAPPSAMPSACRGACCSYDMTHSTPCSVGGGPTASILARVCFDAFGAATDYYVTYDSEADPVYHPDEP